MKIDTVYLNKRIKYKKNVYTCTRYFLKHFIQLNVLKFLFVKQKQQYLLL